MNEHDRPTDLDHLYQRVADSTLRRFLDPWLTGSDRTPDMDDAAAVLDVWAVLSDAGMNAPDWVHAANAAMHYARNGIG